MCCTVDVLWTCKMEMGQYGLLFFSQCENLSTYLNGKWVGCISFES